MGSVNDLFVPFNFDPEETQTKIGSFPIPADKFAMVSNYTGLTVDSGSGVVEIGGSTTKSFTFTGTLSGTSFTASGKEAYWAYIITDGVAIVSFEDKASTFIVELCESSATNSIAGNNNGDASGAQSTYSGEVWFNEGDKLLHDLTSGTSRIHLVPKGEQPPIWVTGGDVLDGEVYTLTLYPKVS